MIVAIDPGIAGAAAALDPKHGFVDVIDLPVIRNGKRGEIDVIRLHRWLNRVKPRRIVVESVHAMPGQGVVSMFRFGVAVGTINAICKLCGGLELVEPAVWKAYFLLPGDDKEASRQMALQLFPETGHLLARKKDHNRAEAELLAWWALRPPVGRNW